MFVIDNCYVIWFCWTIQVSNSSEYNLYWSILHLHAAQCQRWWKFLVFTSAHFVDAEFFLSVYSSIKWFIRYIWGFFYYLIYTLFDFIWKPVRTTVGKATCICFSIGYELPVPFCPFLLVCGDETCQELDLIIYFFYRYRWYHFHFLDF